MNVHLLVCTILNRVSIVFQANTLIMASGSATALLMHVHLVDLLENVQFSCQFVVTHCSRSPLSQCPFRAANIGAIVHELVHAPQINARKHIAANAIARSKSEICGRSQSKFKSIYSRLDLQSIVTGMGERLLEKLRSVEVRLICSYQQPPSCITILYKVYIVNYIKHTSTYINKYKF